MTVSTATGTGWASVAEVDPELWTAMVDERERQRWNIELIASENYTAAAVMEAQGSWLTNKYAEGLPGKRYYGGCEHVDVVERLAISRALDLFPGAEHVNVQAHSGAQANMIAYFSVLKPGDRILGMNLAHGGHLTHGMALNFSGKLYEVHAYGVREDDQRIDYDALERQALEVRPALIVAGASAYPRLFDFERLGDIARAADALLMVDMAHIAGLVAAGVHPSPFPYADLVTTTTHKTLRGPRGGLVFSRERLAKAVDKANFPGIQGGPLMHVIAGKAVALKLAASEEFRADQRRTVENAAALAETVMRLGATVVSGGTDNHLMLVDVTPLGVTGREAEVLLDSVHITVNKNAIPFDPLPPNTASGIRLGTPATTTRGFGSDEMRRVGELIVRALRGRDDADVMTAVAAEVHDICARYPVPGLRST
jgi:glycine hydroxymethyltransferase